MPPTYRAILNGNSLEWDDAQSPSPDHPIPVLVTLLSELPTQAGRGQRMAAALRKLAQTQTFADIDPLLWQQEFRQERPLPGREQR